MRYAYLENTTGTHSKFYEMIENPGGTTFTAKYGRIGNTPQETTYNIGEWHKKFDEKIRKGYVDKTAQKLTSKPKFSVNKEHLLKVDKVMLVLTSYSFEIADSRELIRDVSAIRAILKDPKSKSKGNLEVDDMIFLNEIWKKIKHYVKKN